MNQPTSFTCKAAMLWAVFLISALFAQAQIAKFGNSYVNVSKRATGGTVQPGDTLEIRTCANFETNFNNANGRLVYRIRYLDNIPSNTVYIPGSMRTITNEGLTYKAFTDAAGDDAGIYNAATPTPTQFNIRMNTARTATATSSTLANNIVGATNASTDGGARDKPRVGNGILISTAFRVRVTGVIGDSITLGAGQILYRLTNAGTDQIFNTIQYKILIANNDPICSNSVGRNFVAEAGGTFDSGFVHNRSYGPSFLIPSYTYRQLTVANQIGDGFYTIVNNLSPNRSTRINSRKQPNCNTAPAVPALDSCRNRMFSGHWDIIGDHTGSTTAAGNPPKDSTNPGPGGYMLVVNADYATSEAYRQVISGLCPNTSYEFSLWVRNVCTNCGIDSNATQTWNTGVFPNLTFAIDGLDRYSSGQVDIVGWQKKGFLFKTGPAQTSITISIRNNASGGGGNDWAIDDIALVTCNPNLNMQPTGNANVCIANMVDMSTVVRAFFNNYIFWTWEKSINNGATWNATGISGTGSPVVNGGAYEYTAAFPSFLADSAAHQNRYRFKVASSAANLANPNCAFIDSTVIIIMVNNCNWVLKTKVLSVNGQLVNGLGTLHWTTANEEPHTIYEIERSDDNGQHYKKIGTVTGQVPGNGTQYTFPDNHAITGQAFYRIRVIENGNYDFSRTVLLSNKLESEIRSLINPFNNALSFELIVPTDDVVTITLIDMYGRIIKQAKASVERGLNSIRITGLQSRITGTYTLRVQTSDKTINRQVLKIN
jgi:hypothetical protein